MTDVEFRPRDCFNRHGEGKVAFTTKREARAVARIMRDRVHPYRCPYCDQWHLGNDGPRVVP